MAELLIKLLNDQHHDGSQDRRLSIPFLSVFRLPQQIDANAIEIVCTIPLRGCLIPLLFQKKGFGSSFCIIKLNTMQILGKKVVILYFGFWPQETKKTLKSLNRP
jgi:hypothetical protein